MKMTIPHLSCNCWMTTSLCYPYKHFSVFIPYLDTQRVFIGKNEFMIQFNILDVSFLTKYMTCMFLVKIFCWYEKFYPQDQKMCPVCLLSTLTFTVLDYVATCHGGAYCLTNTACSLCDLIHDILQSLKNFNTGHNCCTVRDLAFIIPAQCAAKGI